MRWKWLLLTALAADLLTLAVYYGLALIEGRLFGDPRFPRLFVFHSPPPSCIVSRENFFVTAFALGVFWLGVAFVFTRLLRAVLDMRKLPVKRVVVGWSSTQGPLV